MPYNKNNNDINKNISSESCDHRRKRINRIKTGIVILVILLLILPTLCCIMLGLQVSRLQKQVDELVGLHGQYGLSYQNPKGEVYAFAAEQQEKLIDRFGHTISPEAAIHNARGEDVTQTFTDPGLAVTQEESEVPSQDAEEQTISSPKDNASLKPNDSVDKENKPGIYEDKKVYLTFDDGPSIYTDDILDILATYNVKATFFVIGKTDEESKKLYQRIVEEGHTLGMHSYSHQYSKIYNSVEDFDKDFTKLWKLLYDTTGYKPSIFRFPGGSDNLVNKHGMEDFIRYLKKAGVVYFDWNVLNGDATGTVYTKEQLIQNVIDGVATKDNSIVLMHDSQAKQSTVDSLPGLLDILTSEGAQILPLNEEVAPIQMIKADTVK